MSPSFGAVIVGDEILSGRREDKHLAALARELNGRGLTLSWARYVGDDPAAQAALYRETLQGDAIVFSFGGIGATPDDHTRASVAAAAGVALIQHPEATALIEARFGEAARPHRIRMAQLPDGCTLIPNPVNQVAGFTLGRHHFVPGFPDMAWPMLRWVLDTHYAGLGEARTTLGFIVPGAKEGDLIETMERMVAAHPEVRLSCLPSYGNARHAGPHIEFSFTGAPEAARTASDALRAALAERGYATLAAPGAS
ncbi:competence/damage-inducible protein A [Chitinimonas koreensis]|uniref:competence/damage-inducible protein A n=1 Tax=Chitinimonas koreensis TaxID=356302 RepID=UPI000406A31A|nr:molybdopterin-binding protein [Chitinimonas koreensis]QNM94958.1 competence/damage-inducible protein A [Chitinimonas koreensis]